jgi:hypothetical protein
MSQILKPTSSRGAELLGPKRYRLHGLKDKQTVIGIGTPPEVLIGINDFIRWVMEPCTGTVEERRHFRWNH